MLDWLFARAVATRRRWYERHPQARSRLQRPVISVGNLSVGGSGKTPLVELIAARLVAAGERPAILSRGYKRRRASRRTVVVSDGSSLRAGLDEAGDEPLLLARAVPKAVVCVDSNRAAAGRLAERELGATVHVLDDGFQHLQLWRDLDILVTWRGEITRGRVLPFGRLRESRDAAARADMLVVMGAEEAEARAEAWTLGVSQFAAAARFVPPPTADLPVLAMAGIARPAQFFATAAAAGHRVVATRAFADHHRFTRHDVTSLEQLRREAGAASIVTTEKDAVRLEALGPLPFSWRALPLQLRLQPTDTLFNSLRAALQRARCAA